MTKLLVRNGLVVTPTEEWFTDILIEGNKIAHVGTCSKAEGCRVIDAEGAYVTPGLFDLQVNGSPECDFWTDLNVDKLSALSRTFLREGVTSILPTLITGDLKQLCKNRDYLQTEFGFSTSSALKKDEQFIRMPGLHFEGPCLSPAKPGVHPPEHLQPLELSILKTLVDKSCKLMTIAPELDKSGACIKFLREAGVICSLGHSNANFEEANEAFSRGVTLMTHTFNALPPLHHREPGAVGAALLNKSIDCCIIPDGLHVLPAMIDLVYRIKGLEKTVLVSDIAAVGTSQGTLVGSSLILSEGIRNMVNWGICDFASAIRMASYNPARLLNLENEVGQLKPGAFADVVLWDRKSMQIKQVIFNGSLIGEKAAAAC